MIESSELEDPSSKDERPTFFLGFGVFLGLDVTLSSGCFLATLVLLDVGLGSKVGKRIV